MKTLLFFLIISSSTFGQLTIEECQQRARENYPLISQHKLIEQAREYNLSNAGKGYLPQLSVSAKATYQSEVTEIPIKIPTVNIDGLSKDQYQAVAELSQVIWDGGIISAQKDVLDAASGIDKQKLEVDLYSLNERVNQLFFGILLLDEQIKQVDILRNELQTNYDRVSALLNNGVANQSDLEIVKVEQLKAEQKKEELLSAVKSYKNMLGIMINQPFTETTYLIKPGVDSEAFNTKEINRPELQLFDAQKNLYKNQESTFLSGTLPKINVFLQGGYGKPGLNMLKNEFSAYYIGGVRLTWNLSSFYSYSNNIDLLELNRQSVEEQKSTFLFNTELKTVQQNIEIEKIKNVLRTDDEIISLRNSIKKASEAKVDNGTQTVSDLVRDINSESSARQDKALHEIQLLIAIYNLKHTINN